jgi:hypothetical protein
MLQPTLPVSVRQQAERTRRCLKGASSRLVALTQRVLVQARPLLRRHRGCTRPDELPRRDLLLGELAAVPGIDLRVDRGLDGGLVLRGLPTKLPKHAQRLFRSLDGSIPQAGRSEMPIGLERRNLALEGPSGLSELRLELLLERIPVDW